MNMDIIATPPDPHILLDAPVPNDTSHNPHKPIRTVCPRPIRPQPQPETPILNALTESRFAHFKHVIIHHKWVITVVCTLLVSLACLTSALALHTTRSKWNHIYHTVQCAASAITTTPPCVAHIWGVDGHCDTDHYAMPCNDLFSSTTTPFDCAYNKLDYVRWTNDNTTYTMPACRKVPKFMASSVDDGMHVLFVLAGVSGFFVLMMSITSIYFICGCHK